MSELVSIDKVLCLSAVDIAALLQGQLIAVIPNISVQKYWTFALCPYVDLNTDASDIQSYHQRFSPLVEASLVQYESESIKIEAWARCEYCKLLHDVEQIEALSSLTIWTKDFLKNVLQERENLFLAFLRVYRLPVSFEVSKGCISPGKMGKFVGLPVLDDRFSKPIAINQFLPILSDIAFEQRRVQLEALKPPMHPELEDLCDALTQLSITDQTAKALEQDISHFLGWNSSPIAKARLNSNRDWIKTIAAVGNSSEGENFEKIVRKSFVELGFSNSRNDPKASLDPETTGGAGGIDFYCDAPFPVVGECKATKSEKVPSKTPGQLIQLGKNHLQEDYDSCIKIIVAAGELTPPAELTSVSHQMNVLRPETLQRLVELKSKHPGSIDLIELKVCLEKSPFGEDSDTKVNNFIDQILQRIKVRANLLQAVRKLQELEPNQTQFETAEIRVQYNAMFAAESKSSLNREAVYEILLELASPLTGYVGRIASTGVSSDRFYFLRSLDVDPA